MASGIAVADAKESRRWDMVLLLHPAISRSIAEFNATMSFDQFTVFVCHLASHFPIGDEK